MSKTIFIIPASKKKYATPATEIGMSQEEYNEFKDRINCVPRNGAGMNGVIYDFVERVIELENDQVSTGTRFLKGLLDDCKLKVPRKIVDALRSNTERLIRNQKRDRQD